LYKDELHVTSAAVTTVAVTAVTVATVTVAAVTATILFGATYGVKRDIMLKWLQQQL
jgi:hypothetical protein